MHSSMDWLWNGRNERSVATVISQNNYVMPYNKSVVKAWKIISFNNFIAIIKWKMFHYKQKYLKECECACALNGIVCDKRKHVYDALKERIYFKIDDRYSTWVHGVMEWWSKKKENLYSRWHAVIIRCIG